jgi:predicted nuclease of restriction endonuclease-like (RecB) superfamily
MTKSINILDKDYSKWIQELSLRYRRSQIKAAVKVNQEMLQFYWDLGRDIVERDAENKYGSGFYEMLSKDLKDAIPMTTGFSDRNLRYAKKFYSLYNEELVKLQQVAAKSDEQNLQQVAAKTMSNIFSVPWGHHMLIIDKVKGNTEKAMFFVHQTVENGWSRNMLLNFLGTDLYERQGKAITNFKRTLPEETSDLAQELTKDPYDFAFTGITGRYNERLLKDKLLNNITNFLIELGTGFAYLGKEYRLQIGETEGFIDLLFYNLKLRCYVAIEVKTGKFESRDIGQIGTYVTAVNHILRDESKDNPTIGLLVCRNKDNTLAKYALESCSQPVGISEYELERFYPEKVEGIIPTIEEIETKINEMTKEIE